MKELRRDHRTPVDMWVEEHTPNGMYFHRVTDISQGGLFIEKSLPLHAGSLLRLNFELPQNGEVLEADAEVVYVRTPEALKNANLAAGMGVKFSQTTGPIRQFLEQFSQPQQQAA